MDKVNVCIVGNAAAIVGRGLGEQIDAHDFVMRFNAFELSPEHAADFGTRTTHHAFWWGDRDKFNFIPGLARIVNGAPYGFLAPAGYVIFHRGLACELVPADFYMAVQHQNDLQRGPTTGFLMIQWMLHRGFSVSIANFDFLKTGHYFEPDHRHTLADHAPASEEKRVLAAARSGLIKIL